ncbi:hypothetical protein ASE90_01665 [Sphingomonas sp. Leaf67]|uniref:hypothetical protein n=1 Tax=Sphingomonas sp. Leaf67 TaxID=1736230 RepID=UPI0006F8291B|nr:hypothetical protein [Sphingomonas sp. Leaf67]KQN91540.1 hypothetical protein ASE90_01665 [Sphingomonas sp. Leaf67]
MVPALALFRRVWWLVPIAALAAGWWWTDRRLADVRLTLANERQVRAQDLADANAAKLKAERDAADRVAAAAISYADRLANRQPLILESTNTVREYAQTDAGRVRCRAADRVQAIDLLDARLAEAAAAPGRRDRPVPADAAAPPSGR